MQVLQSKLGQAAPERRGAAMMLAFLVLSVLMLIVFQIAIGTSTDSRVANNALQRVVMDEAIESALLKTMQDLADDAAAGADAAGGAGPALPGGGAGPALPGLGGALGGGGDEAEGGGPTDSREDAWGKPQQTEINGIALRVLIQDEDSKYNILTMLTEDDEEAEAAFERVARILEFCRKDTTMEIPEADARDMAEAMREFMLDRLDQELPKPALLTDREDQSDRGLPSTLREFLVLPGFNEHHFRDFRDHEGNVVHSIGSFLTLSTSVSTYQQFVEAMEGEAENAVIDQDELAAESSGAGGGSQGGGGEGAEGGGTTVSAGGGVGARSLDSGSDGGDLGDPMAQAPGDASNGTPGIAVNLNTAPNAVLHGISDRRDIDWGFLDQIIEHRNTEDEAAMEADDAEPVYDEFGEEVVQYQIFESVDELSEVSGWESLEPDARDDFLRFVTVQSNVFTIFVTARKAITEEGEIAGFGMTPEERRELEEKGTDLVRTVKSVVWRYQDGDEWKVVPLERWEVLDYQPFEVLDYPEDGR